MLAAPVQILPGPAAFSGLSAEPKYDWFIN
jgi:hypothetical protein